MTSLSLLAQTKAKEIEALSFDISVVKEPSGDFFHYRCDGIDDVGWGCGYRSLQSLCSWASLKPSPSSITSVPTLRKIQEILVEVGDKEPSFINSRNWIGCYEASIVLDQLYNVSSRLIHVLSGNRVADDTCGQLWTHFDTISSPVMIGGDVDAASKTLVGICKHRNESTTWKFLVADPHYIGDDSVEAIVSNRGIQWHDIDIFEHSSFYNFCIPLT